MKKKILFLSFIALFISACSSTTLDWGYTQIFGTPTFDRNGDLYGIENEAENYDLNSYVKTLDGEEIIDRLNRKEDTFLLLSSPSCSHCQKLEPKMVQYLRDSKTEVIRLKIEENLESYHKLISTYSNFDGVLKDATPTIYFLEPNENGCDIEAIDFYDDDDTAGKLERFFHPLYSRSNIYHFQNFAKYESFVSENSCFTYLLDSSTVSYYSTQIVSLAKTSPKYTALIEKDYLSKEDKASLEKRFGELTMAFDNKNGPVQIQAVSEITSYYENQSRTFSKQSFAKASASS